MIETIPDTIEGYLKHCIDKFYLGLLTKYNFKLALKQIEGMGGLYQYENESFCLKIINDRGIVDSTLAPIHNLNAYFDLGLLYWLVSLQQNPNANQWDKLLILVKNLSCEEEAVFIDSNYALLNDLLSEEKYTGTKAELEKVGRERADLLFGKQLKPRTGNVSAKPWWKFW
jgi:hypothetical protein